MKKNQQFITLLLFRNHSAGGQKIFIKKLFDFSIFLL